MSMTQEEWRGGSDTNGGVTLQGGDTHFLIPTERWCFFTALGGSGDVKFILPNALGLRVGFAFHIVFDGTSTQNTIFENYTTRARQNIFDANGAVRTSIDHSTPGWTSSSGIEATLDSNTTSDGVWSLISWGTP